MLKNTSTLFSIQQVKSNTITRILIDLAECPLIRSKLKEVIKSLQIL